MEDNNHDKLSVNQNYQAKLNWEINDGLTLVSITDYSELEKFNVEDTDASPFAQVGFTIVSYMKSVPPTSESSPKFAGRILSVERAGKMASVKIAEDELEGMNFTTFFHVAMVGDNWLFTSKATYAEPVTH